MPKADLDHLEIITLLLDKGANPNAPVKDNTLTRTIFTMQWFFEDGATPFVRAAQSSDTALMKLLLKYGADPKVAHRARRQRADGVGRHRLGGRRHLRAVGQGERRGDPHAARPGPRPEPRQQRGRTRADGRGPQGRGPTWCCCWSSAGAKLETRDKGNRDTDIPGAAVAGHTWQAIDYAEGLVRVGVQSAVERPEAAALMRKLMVERGLPVPPVDRNILSICVVALCQGVP